MAEEAIKTYRGNCHCAAFVFEVKYPEIKKFQGCTCSRCHKSAYLFARLKNEDDLVFVRGTIDELSSYRFGPKNVEHLFCGTCGTNVIVRGFVMFEGNKIDTFSVNTRTFQHGQLPNVWDMEVSLFDGGSFGNKYEIPEFTGLKPKVEVENGKFYTGNCHCGAVRIGVNSLPLDKNFPGRAAECNCSFDNRAGCVWIYPLANEVSIQGEDNVTVYGFNLGLWSKAFCKTCGIHLYAVHNMPSDEAVAKMPETTKQWAIGAAHLRPLNLRVLNGVDLKELKLLHNDGYSNIPGNYIEP